MLNRSVGMALLLVATSSCSTHLIYVKSGSQATDAGPNEPFYEYYLPKQEYTAEVTYRLRACPKDTRDKQDLLQIRQEATVTEESGVDFVEHYYLTYRDVDSVMKTSTFQ